MNSENRKERAEGVELNTGNRNEKKRIWERDAMKREGTRGYDEELEEKNELPSLKIRND